MKRFVTLFLISAIVYFSLPAVSFAAQTDWENLFNGKTLDGWIQRNGKAKYTVQDGMIVGTTVLNTPNSFLCTEKMYTDFILELEFFVKPGTDREWFNYWVEERLNWYLKLGIEKDNLRPRQHAKQELAHYAKECSDIDYLFPMGWAELEGIANRGDFDLVQHAKYSGKSLNYLDEETKEHIIPYIIEPSAGVDRSVLAFLCDAYDEEPDKDETRVLLRFHPILAPYKVAILPLSRRENLAIVAKKIYAELRRYLMVNYDDTQSIGRRYRRQDEIGTPFCITVDFQSLEDKQVTIRERDTLKQIRVPIESLKKTLQAKLEGEDLFVLPPGGKIWKE